jgi:hypothetical protein
MEQAAPIMWAACFPFKFLWLLCFSGFPTHHSLLTLYSPRSQATLF